jgi:alpha-beta hydrolase superfamily lysophospholipase
VPDRIRGGALLLHGLTDSPYSLRAIGELLHDRGFYVLGLRLPGHGTIPGALTTVHWKDWVAASRIGARHVRDRIGPDLPFVLAGYSNGGALSVKYALDALNEPDLPPPDRLLLFSPEIGISKLSVIANSHKLFSFLPYFEQFKWVDIQPEYDPYKYNSFPKNAAQQAHDLTSLLQDQIEESRNSKSFSAFPPVLTFLSWVDATVQTPATIHRLYNRLENKGSELVIFDVDRLDQLASFIPAANKEPLKDLEARQDLPYRLTVITNAGRQTRDLVQRTKAPRSATVDAIDLPYRWPPWIFSLGHVAIPFSPEDPVYGAGIDPEGPYPGLPLGALAPRGETDLLTVPLSKLMRLRYNPFFAYVEKRVAEVIEQLVENMP